MPIDSRERIGPAVAAVVTDVGHESAPTEWWPALDELNPPLDKPNRQHWTPEPRTMLCGTAFRVHVNVAGDRFDELRELCAAAGDKASLAMANLRTAFRWAADHDDLDVAAPIATYGGCSAVRSKPSSR